jgi:hypothetical protein
LFGSEGNEKFESSESAVFKKKSKTHLTGTSAFCDLGCLDVPVFSSDLSLTQCPRRKAIFIQSSRMQERERKTIKLRICMNSMVRN